MCRCLRCTASGRGIVGGPLLSTEALSRTTAQVALRVLAGESPGSIKTPTQRTGQPTYDARELRRWKIDEGRLPPASVVLFREPTRWRRDPRAITLGALLGGIPVVAIVLLVGLIKRRRAESRGPFAKDVLPPGPADDAVRVWTAGADGQRVEAGHPAGAAQHDSWTAFVHPDDVERGREIYRRALERREPFQMEYRVREPGGVERWILDTGLPRFSGKDVRRLHRVGRRYHQAWAGARGAVKSEPPPDAGARTGARSARQNAARGRLPADGGAHAAAAPVCTARRRTARYKPSSPISARNWQAWLARSPRCRTRSISGSRCWV